MKIKRNQHVFEQDRQRDHHDAKRRVFDPERNPAELVSEFLRQILGGRRAAAREIQVRQWFKDADQHTDVINGMIWNVRWDIL